MKRIAIIFTLACIALLLVGGAVRAAIQAYDLPWYTIDGGSGTSLGGDYALSSSIGQPAAGAMSGGIYTLEGGFMPAVPDPSARQQNMYLPMIVR
jgi:hypothetical protein